MKDEKSGRTASPDCPHPTPHSSLTEVAAAIILKPGGEFLLAQRPRGKPYPGYWEFPGGKLLPGETPLAALARELKEELDLTVDDAWPWVTRDFRYSHANVRLHFFRVVRWHGNVRGLEGQELAWQRPGKVTVSPMLPANAPVLHALTLPAIYAISNAGDAGIEQFLGRLKAALQRGARLVQLREKDMAPFALKELARRVLALAEPYAAKVLLNSAHLPDAETIGAHGVHLTAEHLMECKRRPDFELCGASCHNELELAHAAQLELDFVALGPVRETATHRQHAPLGWLAFSRLIANYPLPVYAIGGMGIEDLERASRGGAHGVAMIRGAWSD